jgi:hypothetical protein
MFKNNGIAEHAIVQDKPNVNEFVVYSFFSESGEAAQKKQQLRLCSILVILVVNGLALILCLVHTNESWSECGNTEIGKNV